MGQVSAKLRKTTDGYSYWCQGCESVHSVKVPGWGFNGNVDKPTFTPSVLTTSGHYLSTHKQGDACWCTYNAERLDAPSPFKCGRCHTFITDGIVQFLGDCTHALAGKSEPLPDLPEHLRDAA